LWLRSLPGRSWCAGFLLVGLVLAPAPPSRPVAREFVHSLGTITGSVRRELSVQTCRVRLGQSEYFLQLANGRDLQFGDDVEVRGVTVPTSASEQRTSRVLTLGTLHCQGSDVTVTRSAGLIVELANKWRRSFEKCVEESLPTEGAEIVRSSVLGIDDLPHGFSQHLQDAGAISLASVSGLQVLLLTGLITVGLSRLPVSRTSIFILLCGVLCIYSVATGLHAGVLRASIMTCFLFAAYLFRRERDLLSALATSAVIELLWQPSWVYDFGFQMSFVVVATLCLWLPKGPGNWGQGTCRRLVRVVGALGIMFLASAPMISYQTGLLNVRAPLVGILVAPALPPMFCFAILGWMLSLASPLIGMSCMKLLVGPFAGWILTCTDLSASFDTMDIRVPAFNAYFLVPIYLLMALGARATSRAFSGARTGLEVRR